MANRAIGMKYKLPGDIILWFFHLYFHLMKYLFVEKEGLNFHNPKN